MEYDAVKVSADFVSRHQVVQALKTRLLANSEISEEFEIKFGIHQSSVLSPFVFAIVADVITSGGVFNELLL